jgi:hypothetical protein
MLRRAIFRKLKNIIIERYSELIKFAALYLNEFDPTFLEIFNEFMNAKAIYLNKEQKKNLATNKSSTYGNNEDESATLGVIRRVLYKYSKSAMEEFFQEPRLNYLFHYFADEIKARGHQTSEKRRQGKKVVLDQHSVKTNYDTEVD